jgi:GT2 family glycosyltransferase
MVDLSIILVNWNCLEFTKECLASIRATTHGINYEVLVIDNDSADAPCTGLVEEFPWIKLVLSNKNIGFGPANNLAVRHCEGESFLFLNPDTIVLGDAILQMWNALQSMPWGGAV